MEQMHIARCNATSKVLRDLFLVVSIFLVLFEISTAQMIHYNGLNRHGSHVCSDYKYRQTLYYHQVATIGYVTYKTKCGWFGWGRCRRSRQVTRYRTAQYYRWTIEIYLRCCSGWTRQTKGSKSCHKPVCVRGCNNYGECIRPNTCKCRSGWQGATCSDDINECNRGNGGCQQLCINIIGSSTGPLCSCRRGYINDPSNKKKCIGENVMFQVKLT
ncbi:PREDICTED: epidermal growth factor-like protein 8 [Acropora digitifera]|uniref:epidermal growth factor-like protein 8 n=1 Tax=Acropora digitifera TaxID=70779 RepID=UPI00077A04DA|nr:PREDICTED: epidermal growth factor-like protein 8 [Acropora digitifera]